MYLKLTPLQVLFYEFHEFNNYSKAPVKGCFWTWKNGVIAGAENDEDENCEKTRNGCIFKCFAREIFLN